MAKKVVLQAFVLKKKILLNNDILVTFFTENEGKLTVMAKGVRKITSHRLSYLDTGNLVEAVLSSYKEKFFYLTSVDLISGFLTIKKRKEKYNNFYRSLYLIDRLLPEAQVESDVYRELRFFLFNLARKKESADEERQFFNKILEMLGYINSPFKKGRLSLKIEEIINQKLPQLMI